MTNVQSRLANEVKVFAENAMASKYTRSTYLRMALSKANRLTPSKRKGILLHHLFRSMNYARAADIKRAKENNFDPDPDVIRRLSTVRLENA